MRFILNKFFLWRRFWPIFLLSTKVFGSACQCESEDSLEKTFQPAFSIQITEMHIAQTSSIVLPNRIELDAGLVDEELKMPVLAQKPLRIRVFIKPISGVALGTAVQARLSLFHPDGEEWMKKGIGTEFAPWWLESTDAGQFSFAESGVFTHAEQDAGAWRRESADASVDFEKDAADVPLNVEGDILKDAGVKLHTELNDGGEIFLDAGQQIQVAPVPFIILEKQQAVFTESTAENEKSTFNFDLPAAWIQPGLSFQVEIFEEVFLTGPRSLFIQAPIQGRFWPTSTATAQTPLSDDNVAQDGGLFIHNVQPYLVPIEETVKMNIELYLVPLQFANDITEADCNSEYNICDDTPVFSLTEAEKTKLKKKILAVFPLQDLSIRVAPTRMLKEPIDAFGKGWDAALVEATLAHLEEEPSQNRFTFGMMRPTKNRNEFCPLSCITGKSSIQNEESSVKSAVILAFDDDETAWTLLHEWGHLLKREHAPCSIGAGEVDVEYPYAQATLGRYGFDLETRTQISSRHNDLMSYCAPRWISDYTYRAIYDAFKQQVEVQTRP